MGMRTVRRALREQRDVAEDAKALIWQLLVVLPQHPDLRDRMLLLDRAVGRLTRGLNELVEGLRHVDDRQLRLAM